MNLNDVCKLFGKGPSTIRRWEAEGLLPKAVRAGKSYFWKPGDIARFVDTGGAVKPARTTEAAAC